MGNMKTKEEVIKEAYGKYFDSIKDKIDINGWVDGTLYESDYLEDVIDLEYEYFYEYGLYEKVKSFRPLSLQGIENNKGWIKIESEEDLPKDSFNYYAFCSNGSVMTFNDFEYYKKYIIPELKATHYQPIVKPLPPLY